MDGTLSLPPWCRPLRTSFANNKPRISVASLLCDKVTIIEYVARRVSVGHIL